MDNPVEDGVGQGRLTDQVVPAVDRDLAGDQGGAALRRTGSPVRSPHAALDVNEADVARAIEPLRRAILRLGQAGAA